MFKNYILIALRNLNKNKLYAAINVFGMAIGLAFYLFGGIIADYEYNHDSMWAKQDRIYAVGARLNPEANIGVQSMDTTFSALGPLIATDMAADIESMARTIRRNYVVSSGDKVFRETIRFTDPELLNIFDFTYLYGDKRALDMKKSAVISRQQAEKMFGTVQNALGKVLLLDSQHDVTVTAVIEDLPQDSHFNSSFIDTDGYEIFIPLQVLSTIADWDIAGNWNNLSMGNHVYLLAKQPMDMDDLTLKLNTVYEKHATTDIREGFIDSLDARTVKQLNAAVWDALGMPAIQIIQILSVFILAIAIVNYANLSAAQGMGRVREVGMRKTLGASQGQLMTQFLVESITISALAMVLSLVCLELLIPLFNSATGKVVTIDYSSIAVWLVLTTAVVGFIAGLYPAYLITKVNPISALKQMTSKGAKGNLFRACLIGFQFILSIVILGMVLIMFWQNQQMVKESELFPKDQVINIVGIGKDDIRKKEDVLRMEFMKIPHITHVSFASQVPFEQSNRQRSVSIIEGDEDKRFSVNLLAADPEFLPTFDINLVAGRNLSSENLADTRKDREDRTMNVVVNELLLSKLGLGSKQEAVGQSFYGTPSDDLSAMRYDIVGVIENRKILGAHNELKAWVIFNDYTGHNYAALRIKKGAPAGVVQDIEAAWKRVLPQYPIEHSFLGELFDGVFAIFNAMNMAIAGFALVALVLALIGLFGMAAFMARARTKEIGIRKVLGAKSQQLIRMMLWQFSKPVFWATLIALPLSYGLSSLYLEFFNDSVDTLTVQIPLIMGAGLFAVLLTWGVVALHALRVVRSNPITALRSE